MTRRPMAFSARLLAASLSLAAPAVVAQTQAVPQVVAPGFIAANPPAKPAAGSPLVRLSTGDSIRGWLGVGKLMVGAHGFCSGVLVGPALVMTAAHCLYDEATGQPVPVSGFRFLVGWQDGRAEAYRGVSAAVAWPGYGYGKVSAGRVKDDLALLKLDAPVLLAQVRPFAMAPTVPGPGARVAVVSYSEDHPDAPALQQACDVLARRHGVLVMDCKVNFGASGSPVFLLGARGAAVVTVISAKGQANGRQLAMASARTDALPRLQAALAAVSPASVAPAGVGQVHVLVGGGAFLQAPGDARMIAVPPSR